MCLLVARVNTTRASFKSWFADIVKDHYYGHWAQADRVVPTGLDVELLGVAQQPMSASRVSVARATACAREASRIGIAPVPLAMSKFAATP